MIVPLRDALSCCTVSRVGRCGSQTMSIVASRRERRGMSTSARVPVIHANVTSPSRSSWENPE